jgi:hypothetical protein
MAINLDFYNIKLVARIQKVTGIGDVVSPDKSLLDSTPSKEELAVLDTIFKTMTELSVDESIGYTSSISLTIEPPIEEALDFLDSEFLRFGNILHIRFGYGSSAFGSGPTPESITRYGIMQMPSVDIGRDSSIEIPAFGWGHPMMRNNTPGASTGGQTAKQIVDGYRKRYGLKLDDEDADDVYKTTILNSSIQAEQSDFEYIVDVVSKTPNYITLLGDTLTVRSWAKAMGSPAKATFRLFGPMDIDNKNGPRFPMNDFSFESGALFLPNFARGLVSETINRDTGEFHKIQSNQGNDSSFPGGIQASKGNPPLSQTPKESTSGVVSKPQLPGSKTNVQAPIRNDNLSDYEQEIKSQADESSPYAEIEFETLGNPDIGAGDVVNVELPTSQGGISRLLSGSYLVFGIVHNIGLSGYTMRLTCRTKAAFDAISASGGPNPNMIVVKSVPNRR